MLKSPENTNCYEYLKNCTSIYGDVYMMQHFGVKYYKSKIYKDMDALASYFQNELGLKRGDVYTIYMPTTMQSIIAFYALNKIGVIVSFVHPLMSGEFLKEQIDFVGSKGIMVLDLLAKKHIDEINQIGLPCLVCSSSDYSNGLKRAGNRFGECLLKFGKKYKNCTSYRKAIKCKEPVEAVHNNGDDLAVYLNGGGTTGKAKTIKLTSKAINELVYRVSDLDEIHDPGNEAEIIVLPQFHCFGLCVAIHMALCNSGRIIPMMQFDQRIFIKLMKTEKVVGVVGIPLMFQKLMENKDFDGPHLKNIRLMFCGGDDVTDEFLDEFNSYFEKWGAVGRLRQGYGFTEIASVCCTNTNDDYKKGTIGKALRGVEVQIWDDNNNQVPNGEVGEIVVSGPTLMEGYYCETGEENLGLYIDENGKKWVKSGDLGFKDDDDFYHFCGRKKRVIIIAGYNVYPTDIEKVVGSLPQTKICCAVEGKKNDRRIVRLYIQAKPDTDEEAMKKEIEAVCEDNFSKFYVPYDIIFMDKMPITPLMKVDFMKLQNADPEELRQNRKLS